MNISGDALSRFQLVLDDSLYVSNIAAFHPYPERERVKPALVQYFSRISNHCFVGLSGIMSQKSNLTGAFSPSPSKKRCTTARDQKVDMIGPSYIRMHLLGFAFELIGLSFGFINPGSVDSVRKGVRQAMEQVASLRNATREKDKTALLKFSHRPGPNPKVAGSKQACPYGLSAGTLLEAIST
jgi:hypothetical protein